MEETYIVRIYRKEHGRPGEPEGNEVWDLVGTVEVVSEKQTRAFHGMEELWNALTLHSKESLHE